MLRNPERWCHPLLQLPLSSLKLLRRHPGYLCCWPGEPLQFPVPTKSQPRPPTSAVKCPRANPIRSEEPKWKKKKSVSLTALQEIRKYQSSVEPLLPLLPFIRVIRDLLNLQGPYRITREAILALRTAGEDYIMSTLEGANLACMHRNRCTLAPQDVRLYRRLRGEDEKIGQTEESQEARRRDWEKFRAGRLTQGKRPYWTLRGDGN